MIKTIIFTLLAIVLNQSFAQEYSAGINTENPSQYAVLHLVSPNGNQGLLLPRLSTAQRSALVSILSNTENGLVVYDNDESQIYYWQNGSWVSLIQQITKSGNTITIDNGSSINIGEGTPSLGQGLEWDGTNWIPADPPGIQTLNFSGTTLQILNGNNVDLSTLIDDADPDPANEIQTLSKAGNTVSLSNGGGSFTDEVNDADNVIGNENQTVSAGTGINVTQTGQDFTVTNSLPDQVLNVTDGGSGHVVVGGTYPNLTIDVPSLDDADADPANENQTVSAGTGINVTQTGQNFTVSNSLPDQVVNLTDGGSGNVAIGGTYPNLTVDVPSLDDADADPANENQTVSAGPGINVTQTGQDFTVTNTQPDQVVNLSVGSLNVSVSGSYPNYIIDVPSLDDADSNIGNEFQDLSLAGNTLSLTDDGTPVDLSGYLDNTDIQDLSLAGNTLSLTNDGTPVDLSGYLDNTDNQDLSLAGNTLSLTNDGTPVDLIGYLDNTDAQTVDQFDLTGSTLNLSLLNDGAAPYTVDLSTFSIASVAGAAGNYLTNDGSVTSWDPLGALAQLNTVASTEIADASITEVDLANSIAGNGILGGAGSPLSVDLAPGSGLDFLASQLQMQEVYPGGITYDGGASTAIRTITFDSKGRFVNATSVAVLLSDKRLKKEIAALDNSLEKLIQLNGYNYYLKSDSLNEELKTGVIAQEVEKVFPNLVMTRPDGFLAVEYQGLIPILLESIKEQQAIIEDLKRGLNQQETINSDQESRITAMEGKLEELMKIMSPK